MEMFPGAIVQLVRASDFSFTYVSKTFPLTNLNLLHMWLNNEICVTII